MRDLMITNTLRPLNEIAADKAKPVEAKDDSFGKIIGQAITDVNQNLTVIAEDNVLARMDGKDIFLGATHNDVDATLIRYNISISGCAVRIAGLNH